MPREERHQTTLELEVGCPADERYHRLKEKLAPSKKTDREESCNFLLPCLQEFAILDALHKLHFDFSLLVGDAIGRLRGNDQRLRAIGQIERALEHQRLDAALLAGIFLKSGLKHFRPGMQLVGDV